jgi:hypothetical protein
MKSWKKNMNIVGEGGKQRKKMKTKKRKTPIMPEELQIPTSQTKNMKTNKINPKPKKNTPSVSTH